MKFLLTNKSKNESLISSIERINQEYILNNGIDMNGVFKIFEQDSQLWEMTGAYLKIEDLSQVFNER